MKITTVSWQEGCPIALAPGQDFESVQFMADRLCHEMTHGPIFIGDDGEKYTLKLVITQIPPVSKAV